MSDQNQPQENPRRKKNNPLKPVLVVFILLVLIAAIAGLFFLETPEKSPVPIVSEEQTEIIEKTVLETRPGIAPESQEQETISAIETPVQTEEPPPPEAVLESPEEKRARECKVLAEQIHGFFTHIDSKDYAKQFELQNSSQDYFIALAYKLLKNPPVVSRESDDLYTILKNMAHFFRVIGKDNIILIKTILDRERDKIEDVAAELYQWTAWNSCNDELLVFSPSLAEMYEYAGFFLNTMGGRSYLFRRDSRSRLLVNYYSVLLIERANQEGVNRHGIDITNIIPQLVQEIEASNQLIYKENYIDGLYALLEKYQ